MRRYFWCASESHGMADPFRVVRTAEMEIGMALLPICRSARTLRSWRARAGCRRGCQCALIILWDDVPEWRRVREEYEYGY